MGSKIEDIQKKISKATEGKVDIRGKDYSTVPLRVELFRRDMEATDIESLASVFTKVQFLKDKVVTRAYLAEEIDVIFTEEGKEIVQMKNVKSVGTSEENRDAHRINQTSAVENSETSAIGRMLAVLGLHGGQMASVEEIENAVNTEKVVDLLPKNMNTDKFLRLASECKSVEAINKLLVTHSKFFDRLQKEDETVFRQLKEAVSDMRKSLPKQEKYNG